MKEIVEKTGMSKGAFYHYFKGKENLFLEIAERFMSLAKVDYDNFSRESLFDFYHHYLEHMERFLPSLQEWLGFSGDSEANVNFFLLIFDAMNRYPGYRDETRIAQKHELGAWTEIVGIARRKGEISSSLEDTQIAKIFIAITDGVGINRMLDGNLKDYRKELEILFDCFYKSLRS